MTSVQIWAGDDVGVYQELMRQGKLKTRIYGRCSPLNDYKRWQNTGLHYRPASPMLRVGCLKGYATGALARQRRGSSSPTWTPLNTSGLPRADVLTTMKQTIAEADAKAGLQVNIHAIGDRFNAAVLDYYESLDKTNGPRDRRFRIEHAQHLRQEDIPRFGSLKVIASMQPMHIFDDGKWAWKRIDAPRLKGTYALSQHSRYRRRYRVRPRFTGRNHERHLWHLCRGHAPDELMKKPRRLDRRAKDHG